MTAMLQGSSPIVQIVVTGQHDSEWLKNIVPLGVGVLVGVVLGLFSALFVEPMKFRRLRKIQAAEARDLIYEGLGAIFASLKLSLPMGDEACKALIRRSQISDMISISKTAERFSTPAAAVGCPRDCEYNCAMAN
jgi:gas vesicle protein